MDADFEMPPVGGMNDGDDMDFDDAASFLKVGEEKEIQQGLKKKLVKEGEGYETPENGDEVEGINRFVDWSIYLIACFFLNEAELDLILQCITLGLCWMGRSLILAVIEERLLNSLLDKVCESELSGYASFDQY